MPQYDWEEQRRLGAILQNVELGGGVANLPRAHLEMLVRHPAYTDPSHPLNGQLSKTVSDWYATHHSGYQHPQG